MPGLASKRTPYSFELLINDYAMPDINCLEAMRQARLRRPNLPALRHRAFRFCEVAVQS